MLFGCASEEDTIVMAPVPVVQNQFEPTTEWTSSIGDGVGHYFSRLTPVYAYQKKYTLLVEMVLLKLWILKMARPFGKEI